MLPIGFYDLIFDEAVKNYEFTKTSIDYFLQNGYRLVKTPLVEYEKSYDTKNKNNLLRIADTENGENLVFRNDITIQILRLMESKFNNVDLPLKLCYFGDILRAKSDELYLDKQQSQVGCEIIGYKNDEAIFEVLSDTLKILKNLNLKNLYISLSVPKLVDFFVNQQSSKNREEIKNAILKKDLYKIKSQLPEHYEILAEILLKNNDFKNLYPKICQNFGDEFAKNELKLLDFLQQKIAKNFQEINCVCDLFGDKIDNYHSSITFDIFVDNFQYPIAKGGCYQTNYNNAAIDAVGSTIYINFLRKLI
jgi:ATP phosphoribosyltransferase regulatory subunit